MSSLDVHVRVAVRPIKLPLCAVSLTATRTWTSRLLHPTQLQTYLRWFRRSLRRRFATPGGSSVTADGAGLDDLSGKAGSLDGPRCSAVNSAGLGERCQSADRSRVSWAAPRCVASRTCADDGVILTNRPKTSAVYVVDMDKRCLILRFVFHQYAT